VVFGEIGLIGRLRDALAAPSQAWDLVAELGLLLEREMGCSGKKRELILRARSQVIDLIVAETNGIFVDTSEASATITALERMMEKRTIGKDDGPWAGAYLGPVMPNASMPNASGFASNVTGH